MTNYMSYGDVARALDTTLARAKGKLVGLPADLVTGNGRIKLFEEKSVKAHLYYENETLLTFLGYLSQDESYDVTVQTDQLDASSV